MTDIKPTVHSAVKRIKSFQEISLGLAKKSMMEEGIRCPQCPQSPCNPGCPLGVDIPAFIRLLREGDAAGALAKIREANDLPAICGRVCMAPCEQACVFAEQKKSIGIRALERYASDHGRPRFALRKSIQRSGKKVAVIGSGPAGLTAAAQLAAAGLKVIVYEMMPHLGGMLRYGMPEFRLPKNVLDAEIEEIRLMGVEFKTNFSVGQSMKFAQFVGEGYSAVLLTVGQNSLSLVDLPGADLGGVYYSKEILLSANTRFVDQFKRNPVPVIADQVAVIGYGNAALDCARICLRLGREVTLIFPETAEDLKVYPDDVAFAQEEGLKFEALTKPLSILADNSAGNFAAGVQCVRMDFADTDGSGKWEIKPVPSSEFVVSAQTVILAGGFKTNAAALALGTNLKLQENGSVWIDPQTSLTSVPHLYAAGDVVAGASSIVAAMASGKKAAQSIIKAVR
ncbi:MAG: FAD-dependent oxidoreductase [Candidatus Omnitrophica bacterium]|nr:FAD-dependent oxidoreductase [Candidatus Omnitrophota bacterium]